MSRSTLLSLAVAIATTTLAGTAAAVPEYPPQIKRDLGASYEPPCRICHVQGTTGAGTLQTGFAMAMRARGLTGDERTSLDAALTKMRADRVDSDGDGAIDVDELTTGTDPNSPAPGARLDDELGHGCGYGRSGYGRSASGAGTFIGLALLMLARRRRDRRADR